MNKKKKSKILVIKSSVSNHTYIYRKNNKNILKKFSIKKFDPIIKKHVLYNLKK